MLTGRYRIALRTPMSTLRGALTLAERDGTLTGFLESGSGRYDIRNGSAGGEAFRFEGRVRTPFGLLAFTAEGAAAAGALRGTVHTRLGSFPFTGDRE